MVVGPVGDPLGWVVFALDPERFPRDLVALVAWDILGRLVDLVGPLEQVVEALALGDERASVGVGREVSL